MAKTEIDWDDEPRLGVLPDNVLAESLGVTKSRVRCARRLRKIPPSGGRRSVFAEFSMLGVPAGSLAAVLNVDVESIYSWREMGVPAHRSKAVQQVLIWCRQAQSSRSLAQQFRTFVLEGLLPTEVLSPPEPASENH